MSKKIANTLNWLKLVVKENYNHYRNSLRKSALIATSALGIDSK